MIKLNLTFNDGEKFNVWVRSCNWITDVITAVQIHGCPYSIHDLKLVNDKPFNQFKLV